MKNIFSLIGALVLCLLLCSCGKNEATILCENYIDSCNITPYSKDVIDNAHNAYNSLSEKEQKKVDNYDQLLAAEEKYEKFTQQLETLLLAEPCKETLESLRQLPEIDSVNDAISSVSLDIFKQYITSDDFNSSSAFVSVSLLYEVDGEYLIASESHKTPRADIKSSFRLYSSESQIRFYAGGGLFSRTDRFKYNRTDFCWVSWQTTLGNTISKEKVSKLGMRISGGLGNYEWPYTMSEETLNEMFDKTTDADEFLRDVDIDLKKMGMPFSAWELAGIYDPEMR